MSYKDGSKTIKLLVNLYHHYPGDNQTRKYTIPFKKRTKRVTDEEMASGIYKPRDGDAVEGLQFIKDNYDKLRELFTADDQWLPVKYAMGGFIKRFFKEPKREQQSYKRKPYNDVRFDESAGFDAERYNANRGAWTDKPIGDFKRLFT